MVVAASQPTLTLVWGVSLLLGLAVLVVVVALLQAILRTVRRVHDVAGTLWTQGQRLANNTVHVALLERTTLVLEGVVGEVRALRTATERIRDAMERTGGRI
jgi:hypothetical protein